MGSASAATTSIERLPEENVSIIETYDGRDDRNGDAIVRCFFSVASANAMATATAASATSTTTRKKLYFNPAYFEPHLLLVIVNLNNFRVS